MESELVLRILLRLVMLVGVVVAFGIALAPFRGRPLLFGFRWLAIPASLLCLVGLAVIIPLNLELHQKLGMTLGVSWLAVVVFVVTPFFFWFLRRRIVVFGASREYSLEGFRDAAEALELPSEEKKKNLVTIGGEDGRVDLKVAGGIANLVPRNRNSESLARRLAAEMNRYFREHPGRMNYLPSVSYCLLGFLCLYLGVKSFLG